MGTTDPQAEPEPEAFATILEPGARPEDGAKGSNPLDARPDERASICDIHDKHSGAHAPPGAGESAARRPAPPTPAGTGRGGTGSSIETEARASPANPGLYLVLNSIPKPETRNPKPETRNPRPETGSFVRDLNLRTLEEI